jgi:hypothetical protein
MHANNTETKLTNDLGGCVVIETYPHFENICLPANARAELLRFQIRRFFLPQRPIFTFGPGRFVDNWSVASSNVQIGSLLSFLIACDGRAGG